MMGAVGVVCILAGFSSVWYLQVLSQRGEMDTLRQLSSAMGTIGSEIQSHQTPLPRIFHQVSKSHTGKTARLFGSVSQAVDQGELLTTVWTTQVKQTGFSREVEDLLLQVGRSFSGNQEQICKVLDLVSDCFERKVEQLQAGLPDRQRSCGALCFSGGALLLILLL